MALQFTSNLLSFFKSVIGIGNYLFLQPITTSNVVPKSGPNVMGGTRLSYTHHLR
ncbi:hypothetical protein [Larkinella arboricola]